VNILVRRADQDHQAVPDLRECPDLGHPAHLEYPEPVLAHLGQQVHPECKDPLVHLDLLDPKDPLDHPDREDPAVHLVKTANPDPQENRVTLPKTERPFEDPPALQEHLVNPAPPACQVTPANQDPPALTEFPVVPACLVVLALLDIQAAQVIQGFNILQFLFLLLPLAMLRLRCLRHAPHLRLLLKSL